jgi:DNA-binding MarR family transcriptional regulator
MLEVEFLKERGVSLTMNEVHVLEAVQKSEVTTMKEVSQRLSITQGTLTTSINKLVNKGYVKKYKIVDDKRKTLLGLTMQGQSIVEIHNEFHRHMIERVTEDYKLEDQIVLLESLHKLKNFFDTLQEKDNENSY